MFHVFEFNFAKPYFNCIVYRKPAHGEKMLEKLQKQEIKDVDVKQFNDKFVQQYCSEVIKLQMKMSTLQILASYSHQY